MASSLALPAKTSRAREHGKSARPGNRRSGPPGGGARSRLIPTHRRPFGRRAVAHGAARAHGAPSTTRGRHGHKEQGPRPKLCARKIRPTRLADPALFRSGCGLPVDGPHGPRRDFGREGRSIGAATRGYGLAPEGAASSELGQVGPTLRRRGASVWPQPCGTMATAAKPWLPGALSELSHESFRSRAKRSKPFPTFDCGRADATYTPWSCTRP